MTTHTFPRELRLLTPHDFQFVFQQAQRAGSSYFTILGRENSLMYPRVGLVIAKKSVKKAHDRNRIKRIVRQYFRLNQHQFPAVDFIFLAKKGIDTLGNEEFRLLLDKSWARFKRCA